MHYVRVMLPVLLVYLEASSNYEPRNLVVGFLVAAGITVMIRPRRSGTDWRRLPAAVAAAVKYVIILAADLIRSGIQVARIVLNPALPIKPGIVAIPTGCESELGTALSAHAISLTPGELVIEMDEQGVMYTSCLDVTTSEKQVAEAQRLREDLLKKIIV